VAKKQRTKIPGLRLRLRAAREATGISQSEVARRLDCTRSSVWNWEDGVTEPRAARLRELATLYNVSHEWLANGDDAVICDAVRLEPDAIIDGQQRLAAMRLMKRVRLAQVWQLETDIMAGKSLKRGDILVIEPTRSADPNDVVLVDYRDKGVLVRVYYPPYFYALPLKAQPAPLQEGPQVMIVGVLRERLSVV